MDDLFKNLSWAVVYWLEYQQLCGHGSLFSESYLAQPIGEFLHLWHNGRALAEYNHPVIVRPGRGRRRQIDYVLLGRNTKEIVAALEVKWVGDAPLNKQRLIDDLLRLECIASINRYFLVVGNSEHIQPNLVDLVCN